MKIAINGLGRIGRATLKNIIDRPNVELIAVNDLVPPDNLAYLLRYDSVYGRYEKEVKSDEHSLWINGKKIKVLNEKDPSKLPWKELDVDLVFECTGLFTNAEELKKHINAGAKRVILSAPSKSETIDTVVYGVNAPESSPFIVSCASCTTNCITPLVEIIGRRIGIEKAVMTTVHAYTSSQSMVDSPNKKYRRGRAGAINFVPTSTGAAEATTKVLPQYKSKFNGIAIRGPVPVGSIADVVFLTMRSTNENEINQIFKEESQTPRYKDVIGVSEEPIVSSDIIRDSRASIIDLTMTMVVDGNLVKVLSWYDNEWGYVNQMIREALKD